MKIKTDYITKHANYEAFIAENPNRELNNIIVIPALGEPDLLNTIESLGNCIKSKMPIEIIVVLNSSVNSNSNILEQNQLNQIAIEEWASKNNSDDFKIFNIHLSNIPVKDAGAGYARKVGMDEAIRRFIKTENSGGIISSLDADALLSENYLLEIEKLFNWDKSCNGCSIYFEHPIHGNQFEPIIYNTIIDYELHLRYYKQMLKYLRFPYYHHTVGSSFAVGANAYCKQGGMNKKQAGEDFYFLHKIMPLGHYYELNTCCVFPSSRASDRVPFGTGATIKQFAVEEKQQFLTYNFKAFEPIKILFDEKEKFFKIQSNLIEDQISNYDKALKEFLILNNFKSAINEINLNTSSIYSFTKRFFNWFDAFRIMKYLNFAHEGFYIKQVVNEAALLCINSIENHEIQENNPEKLLHLFRNKEKSDLYIA
jgi:hypothetical protein